MDTTIMIPVSPDIAAAYKNANETQQQQLQQLITAFFSTTTKNDPLGQIIAEMQRQAVENGLTPEIIDAIDADTTEELSSLFATELKRKIQLKKLFNSMDALSAEAQANGLTPEILDSILAEEDDEDSH